VSEFLTKSPSVHVNNSTANACVPNGRPEISVVSHSLLSPLLDNPERKYPWLNHLIFHGP